MREIQYEIVKEIAVLSACKSTSTADMLLRNDK